MGLFGGKSGSAGGTATSQRSMRHSAGWTMLSKHLSGTEGLRVLDIGPTSAGNINFVTTMGHSIYMANLVEDAARPEYLAMASEATGGSSDEDKPVFSVERYLSENLDFAGRTFDVVLLWDTADYLPESIVKPVIDRLYDVMAPGGQLLASFHSKPGDDAAFSRYHLTSTDALDVQRLGTHPLLHTYTTRQIETLFQRYASHKFFLAKDTLREVNVVR
jgi:SAM-dependent methyltransferase